MSWIRNPRGTAILGLNSNLSAWPLQSLAGHLFEVPINVAHPALAPIAVGLKNLGFTNIFEVNNGNPSIDPHYANMRAFQWAKGKEWLLLGGLRDDDELCSQLALPGYHINSGGKLVIESKKSLQDRGEKSPDDADAFLLTFARSVASPAPPKKQSTYRQVSPWS